IAAAPAEPSAAATRIADPDAECVLVALQLEPFHALTKAAGDADLRPVPGLDLDAALDVVDAHLAVGDKRAGFVYRGGGQGRHGGQKQQRGDQAGRHGNTPWRLHTYICVEPGRPGQPRAARWVSDRRRA